MHICIIRNINYLANVFYKVKRKQKSPTLCFMLGAIIRERLLLLQGCVCYCINLWLGFTLYTLRGGKGGFPVTRGHIWRPSVDRAVAAGG